MPETGGFQAKKKVRYSMTINANDVTIKNEKVRDHLLAYLQRIGNYKNFNEDMPVRIYCDSKKDFTAFEAVDYMLVFSSSAHKMQDTISSKISVEPTTYAEFYNHVLDLSDIPFKL